LLSYKSKNKSNTEKQQERRRNMKKTIVAVLVVAFLVTAGVAMAQGWGRGSGSGPGPGPYGPGSGPGYGPRGAWGPGLNLTPEQNQKMQALQESFLNQTLPLRNEMQIKQLELRTLWAQTNSDQAKILAKQKEINALREQLQEKATQNRLEMRKILTPEQQSQLGAYGPGFGPGYGPGYGMRGGMMGGGFGPGRGMGYGTGYCPRW
jgi:Spy/CpxP family protein refolding chaperone